MERKVTINGQSRKSAAEVFDVFAVRLQYGGGIY